MRVRYLRADEIENAVAELLRNFCTKRNRALSAPVPVEDILEKHFQVKLEIKDLGKMLGIPDVLGAAWFSLGIVRIDERIVDQEGRYCFTLGHELGHWVLHRPQVEAERVARTLFGPGNDVPSFVCRTSEKKAPAEWQADQFAARLLMPARLVRDAFTATCGTAAIEIEGFAKRRNDPGVLVRWREVATAVIDGGGFTNVSNEAMRYRLSDLQLVREPGPTVMIH